MEIWFNNSKSETKEIIGFLCKSAIVKFEGNIKEEFTIFYTDEIDIYKSNWCSPFHDISGVLLEYEVRKYNYKMKLKAVELVREEIENSYFEIPADYETIEKKEMDEMFKEFRGI